MSERITTANLRGLVAQIEARADALGIIETNRGERLVLDEGSITYGRAFRLHSTGWEGDSGHSDPFHLGSGYLGSTKREAWLSLRALLYGMTEASRPRRRSATFGQVTR